MPNLAKPRAERKAMTLPGRVTWKDARGTTRFASVTTRNVSDSGLFIDWNEATTIPLYRLVSFQIERDVRGLDGIPHALRNGKVLTVVYRLGRVQRATGTPEGYGLRLMVDPHSRVHTAPAAERGVDQLVNF